jgi:putative hydrolase of HD superfamily
MASVEASIQSKMKTRLTMEKIADLLFEARMLKEIPRSGYPFLGAGRESVAEHSFSTAFIAYVLTWLTPEADAHRTVCMCLLHDLPEARIGDQNTVHKRYVRADEEMAFADTVRDLPFGPLWAELLAEFNAGESIEAKLAGDADQISLILELKNLQDIGYRPPADWLPNVVARVQTEAGKKVAGAVLKTDRDAWWRKVCS